MSNLALILQRSCRISASLRISEDCSPEWWTPEMADPDYSRHALILFSLVLCMLVTCICNLIILVIAF